MIKVIVAITTYNLEEYIAQALDSILMQKTSFDFKIRIADDCSTDKTIDILKDYQKRYPEIVEVLFADKNMGSLANSNRLFDHIDCEYFSFLDGDDYWIGEDRLQKQVDFLDNHPEYTMCAGNTQFLVNNELGKMMIEDRLLNRSYDSHNYADSSIPFIHTSSILVRNVIFINGIPDYYKKAVGTFEESALRGEDFRRLLHLQHGPIFVMDSLFSVYRIHERGMWQGSTKLKRIVENAIQTNFYYKYFGDAFDGIFAKQSRDTYKYMMLYLLSNNLITTKNQITEKECELFTDLLRDISSRLEEKMSYKNPVKWKMNLLKVLSDILHII